MNFPRFFRRSYVHEIDEMTRQMAINEDVPLNVRYIASRLGKERNQGIVSKDGRDEWRYRIDFSYREDYTDSGTSMIKAEVKCNGVTVF